MKPVAILLVCAAVACGTDETELEQNQGVCNDLAEAACIADTRCQQAYENSGHQPMPFATKCLLVEAGPSSTAACETLSYDTCRARNDCGLIYWQDLGPDDGPVGDPYYKSCASETTLNQ